MKIIKRKSAVRPITGSIVDSTNIADKTTNTYSANTIDGLILEKYSTTEQVVGTWVDGKPIYRKVIETGAIANSVVDDEWSMSIANNIDHIVNFNSIIFAGNYYFSGPRVNPVAIDYSTTFYVSGNNLKMVKGQYGGITNSWHTIEYTKTTD